MMDETQPEIVQNPIMVDQSGVAIRICIHICEKKKRQCKFNALKNCDYCVQHLAFHQQTDRADRRMICPMDPKHSVYEKNFEKHLKKCNAREKTLGDYDVKNINICDKRLADAEPCQVLPAPQVKFQGNHEFKTYKELTVEQLVEIVNMLVELDKSMNLYDLENNKLNDEYIESELVKRNDMHQKHMKQISSIVCHVDSLRSNNENFDSICLVELGAGRGRLSYWLEKARAYKLQKNKSDCITKKNLNILLIERGSQRYKFDTLLKAEAQESNSEFERIRIDLKDLYLNKVPLIVKSSKYVLYGKHLCGVATDYALRCLKYSLEHMGELENQFKFGGFVLAVCCHHQCNWESFCGQNFLKKLNIDEKLFYILRSMSSWCTCGERENMVPSEVDIIPGYSRQKIGRICKNLFDTARLQYLNENLNIPSKYKLSTKLFYYIDSDVTLENSMIYVTYEENKPAS